jgi:hypothetical protein
MIHSKQSKTFSKIVLIFIFLLPHKVKCQSYVDIRLLQWRFGIDNESAILRVDSKQMKLKNFTNNQEISCSANWNNINLNNIPTLTKGGFVKWSGISGVEGFGTLKVTDTNNSLILKYSANFIEGEEKCSWDKEGTGFFISKNLTSLLFSSEIGTIEGIINNCNGRQPGYINLSDSGTKLTLTGRGITKIELGGTSIIEVFNNDYTFNEFIKGYEFDGKKVFKDGSVQIGTFSKDKFLEGKLITVSQDTLTGKIDKNDNFIVSKIENPRDKWVKTLSGCEIFCGDCSAKEVTWTGSCLNGKANGKGTLKIIGYDDKLISSYDGILVDGKENGLGAIVHKDGNKYNGNWKNGIKEGNGTWIWTDNSKYIGQFKNNNFNGLGTSFWSNGKIRSKGTFKDDNIYSGTRFYEDGTIEYTVLNGEKKLSSAAERIAKLESQLENNRRESNNSRVQNERNQEEQNSKNNLTRPCLVKLGKMDKSPSYTETSLYVRTPTENSGYDNNSFEITYWFDGGRYVLNKAGEKYSSNYGDFNTMQDAISYAVKKIVGCKTWANE